VIAVLALAVAAPAGARAQHVTAGAQLAVGEYAEQAPSLRFSGAGVAGRMSVVWRRYELIAGATRLALRPRDPDSPSEAFDLTQTDVRLRVRATRLVSVEAGFVGHVVEPLYAAQSMGAARLGAVLACPLAIGADVSARASYLAAGKFSGGGSAPFGVEVGLAASYAPWAGRVRATGDLEFRRLDRRITTAAGALETPIQSTVARVGLQLAY
jgi:hypothetical protein